MGTGRGRLVGRLDAISGDGWARWSSGRPRPFAGGCGYPAGPVGRAHLRLVIPVRPRSAVTCEPT